VVVIPVPHAERGTKPADVQLTAAS
jgi:hypothetical protein